MQALRLGFSSLKVPAAAIKQTLDFYHHLGMANLKLVETEGLDIYWIGYQNPASSFLELRVPKIPMATSEPPLNASYWKIGLSLQDVPLACSDVQQSGITVNPPRQFLEIGFLTNVKDPCGNATEFLQHDFEANYRPIPPAQQLDTPLKQAATIGQITLRTNNAGEAAKFYQDLLGMSYLSKQPVTQYGFDLYFYASTGDVPPNPSNLEAVENREWLWKKPYTQIELQHYPQRNVEYQIPQQESQGFGGIGYFVNGPIEQLFSRVESSGFKITKPISVDPIYQTKTFCLIGPDNVPVTFLEEIK